MHGTVTTGQGAGGQFVAEARDMLRAAAGFRPFDGTFNLIGVAIDGLPARRIDEVGDEYCEGVLVRPIRIGGVRAAAIRPIVPNYPDDKTEVIAPVHLRTLFDLDDGARVPVSPDGNTWPASELSAEPEALNQFDAVVFDLDGTLLDLAVDWPATYSALEGIVGDHLDAPMTDHRHDEVFQIAAADGHWGEFDALLTEREVEGAHQATPRPALSALDHLNCPVGVCTINATEAARVALEEVGVRNRIAAIIGRDGPATKPDPTPLEQCLDELGADPGNAAFVGDARTDAETAQRAGASFLHPDQLRSGERPLSR